MQHRIAARFNRLHHVGHRRQRLVLDPDQADGVFGDVAGVRYHQHHRLADVADFSERDATLLHRRIGEARQGRCFPGRVLAGYHGNDARQGGRRAAVDRFDAGVRVRASQHGRARHVGQRDVVDEPAAPDQKARSSLRSIRVPMTFRC